MAIRTHRVVTLQGVATAEYDYDDATGQILRVRGINDGPSDFYVRVRGTADSGKAKNVDYEHTFPPYSGTTEFDIPIGQRKQFDLEPDGGSPVDPYPTLRGLTVEASY